MKLPGRAGLALLAVILVAAIHGGCGVSGVASEDDDAHKQTAALQVIGLKAREVSDTSAVLEWSTTRSTVGILSIGLLPDLSTSVRHTTGFASYHQLALTELAPDTLYYYRVQAITSTGDTTSARGTPFRTDPWQPLQDSTSPLIRDIEVGSVTSSAALLRWETDDRARCTVHYGLTSALELSQAEYPDEPERYACGHTLTLNDLEPGRMYTFSVHATNLAGLLTESDPLTFTTLAPPMLAFCPAVLTVSADAEFDVNLCIASVQDLAGAAVTLHFDPRALEVAGGSSGVSAGAFFQGHGGHLFMPPVVDAIAGTVRIEASWLITYAGDVALGTEADGGGVLASIRCRFCPTFAGTATVLDVVLTDIDGDGEPDTELLDDARLAMAFESEAMTVTRSSGR
jgi:hypothetical protein